MIDADDPYGDCVTQIRGLIREALELSGEMNETEYQNLLAFEEYLRVRDNA